jgi:O-antigen ligase
LKISIKGQRYYRGEGNSVKWVGLALLSAAMVFLSDWLRRNPLQAPKIWMLFGLMPFLMTVGHLVMAFVLLDGDALHFYVHGAEFSVLDALAIALYFSQPNRPEGRYSLPFKLAMAVYCFAVLLSLIQSIYPSATLFYAWQLARMFFIYAVVAKACTVDTRVPSAILTGMAVGLFLQTVFVIWERFGLGVQQASGTFDHQNILGMISHLVVFPSFALLLVGRGGRLPAAIVLSGAIIEVLTASRATIGLAILAYALVFILSALRHWTPRKARILFVGLVAIAIVGPVAVMKIEVRGGNDVVSSDNARTAMENAAYLLISRYPLGVGANNYVLAANISGANAAAGVDWTSNSIFVHNAYLLVAAETGYFGLVSFILLLICPLLVAFRCGWNKREDPRGDLLLGLGVALLAAYLHAAFEWVFLLDLLQYMVVIQFGMIVGFARQLGYWKKPYALRFPSQMSSSLISSKSTAGTVRPRDRQPVHHPLT